MSRTNAQRRQPYRIKEALRKARIETIFSLRKARIEAA
jgi:hypothetical protein